jgi:hypothetical protein
MELLLISPTPPQSTSLLTLDIVGRLGEEGGERGGEVKRGSRGEGGGGRVGEITRERNGTRGRRKRKEMEGEKEGRTSGERGCGILALYPLYRLGSQHFAGELT